MVIKYRLAKIFLLFVERFAGKRRRKAEQQVWNCSRYSLYSPHGLIPRPPLSPLFTFQILYIYILCIVKRTTSSTPKSLTSCFESTSYLDIYKSVKCK